MKTKPIYVTDQGNTYFDKRSPNRPSVGCWIWAGPTKPNGYPTGEQRKPDGRSQTCYAHRYSYTRWVGAIPEGLTIDHLCGVPSCVNPAHLEAVTFEENQRRKTERKKFCKYGHPYTKESRVKDKTSSNGTICKDCMRAYSFRSSGKGTFEEGLQYVADNPIDRTPKHL